MEKGRGVVFGWLALLGGRRVVVGEGSHEILKPKHLMPRDEVDGRLVRELEPGENNGHRIRSLRPILPTRTHLQLSKMPLMPRDEVDGRLVRELEPGDKIGLRIHHLRPILPSMIHLQLSKMPG